MSEPRSLELESLAGSAGSRPGGPAWTQRPAGECESRPRPSPTRPADTGSNFHPLCDLVPRLGLGTKLRGGARPGPSFPRPSSPAPSSRPLQSAGPPPPGSPPEPARPPRLQSHGSERLRRGLAHQLPIPIRPLDLSQPFPDRQVDGPRLARPPELPGLLLGRPSPSHSPEEPTTSTSTMPGAGWGQKPGHCRTQDPPVWTGDAWASGKRAGCRVRAGGPRLGSPASHQAVWGFPDSASCARAFTHGSTQEAPAHPTRRPCSGGPTPFRALSQSPPTTLSP